MDGNGCQDPSQRGLAVEGAAAEVDVRLELAAELVHVACNRDRVGVTKRAEALPEDPVADVQEQVEVRL